MSDIKYPLANKEKVNSEIEEINEQLAQTVLEINAVFATLAEEGDDWEVAE